MDRGTREHYRNAIALLILAGGARLLGAGIALYQMARDGVRLNEIAGPRLDLEIAVAFLTLMLAVTVLVRPRVFLLPASVALLAQAAWLLVELVGYEKAAVRVWQLRFLLGLTGVGAAYLIYVWWRLGQPEKELAEDDFDETP